MKYPVEVTERPLPGGGTFRCTKVIDPTEALRREIHAVLVEGIVGPEGPEQQIDLRKAMAIAVSRIFGLKLASPEWQEKSVVYLRNGMVNRRAAGQIGLLDLWLAVANWNELEPAKMSESVKIQGPRLPNEIRKAAYRARLRFVLTEAGWAEREYKELDKATLSRDVLDIDFGVDEATGCFLAALPQEEKTVLILKYRGYSRKAIQEKLGWPKQEVERIWRKLAADRAGRTLRDEIVFYMTARYRQAIDN